MDPECAGGLMRDGERERDGKKRGRGRPGGRDRKEPSVLVSNFGHRTRGLYSGETSGSSRVVCGRGRLRCPLVSPRESEELAGLKFNKR